jgi:succinate dehydrogenase / fumarate reductase flavoprotein subunit
LLPSAPRSCYLSHRLPRLAFLDAAPISPEERAEGKVAAPLQPQQNDRPEFVAAVKDVEGRISKLLSIKGKKTPTAFHRELGKTIWDECGMARNRKGLEGAIERVRTLRDQFWTDAHVTGSGDEVNKELEKAGRVADFFELGELMCRDALAREESAGGHFREEYQTPEGEAQRDDENFCYTSAWQWKSDAEPQGLVKEPLTFDYVKPTQRSYK